MVDIYHRVLGNNQFFFYHHISETMSDFFDSRHSYTQKDPPSHPSVSNSLNFQPQSVSHPLYSSPSASSNSRKDIRQALKDSKAFPRIYSEAKNRFYKKFGICGGEESLNNFCTLFPDCFIFKKKIHFACLGFTREEKNTPKLKSELHKFLRDSWNEQQNLAHLQSKLNQQFFSKISLAKDFYLISLSKRKTKLSGQIQVCRTILQGYQKKFKEFFRLPSKNQKFSSEQLEKIKIFLMPEDGEGHQSLSGASKKCYNTIEKFTLTIKPRKQRNTLNNTMFDDISQFLDLPNSSNEIPDFTFQFEQLGQIFQLTKNK